MTGTKLLRYAEVSKRYGVPLGTLRWWVHKRLVPHVRVSPRGVFFDAGILDSWFAQNVVQTKTEQMVATSLVDVDFNDPPLCDHGTVRRYDYWGCRCFKCYEARSKQNRRYRKQKLQEQTK